MTDEEIIKKLMCVKHANNWSQQKIADDIQCSIGHLNLIINGKKPLKKWSRARMLWYIEKVEKKEKGIKNV